MAWVSQASQVTPRTARNKIPSGACHSNGVLSPESTDLSLERTGVSSRVSAGAAPASAVSPRKGLGPGTPRVTVTDMRPSASTPRSNGEYGLCRAVLDETDYIVQRVSLCVTQTFEHESMILHQRVAEELMAQRRLLQESLSRLERVHFKPHERLGHTDPGVLQGVPLEPIPVQAQAMCGDRSADDPVCERDNNGDEDDRADESKKRVDDEPDGQEARKLDLSEASTAQQKKLARTGTVDSVKYVSGALLGIISGAAGETIDLAAAGARNKYFANLSMEVPAGPFRTFLQKMGKTIQWWEDLEEPKRTSAVARLVDHPAFEIVSMSVVVGDQVLTTVNANYAMENLTDDMPRSAIVAGYCFTAFFFVELILKLIMHRMFFFCCGQWKMNCLDFFLVVYSFLEAVAMRLSFLRVLRMFKMAKIVRMLKALTAVHDLRIMLDCLLGSFFGLFWALVLICVIMYIFALIFCQALTEYMIAQGDAVPPETQRDIVTYFGSVETSALSVYQILTGGRDWGEMYELVVLSGSWVGSACLVMVAFFTISVWNIITSVFIEKAMKLAQPSVRDLVKQQRLQNKVDAREVAALFAKLDHDGSGHISRAEFKEICTNREIQEFLSVRDLDIQRIRDFDSFFDMVRASDEAVLGGSKHDEVSVRSLVAVCLHLKGNATNLDLHKTFFDLFEDVRKVLGVLTEVRTDVQSLQRKLKPLDVGLRA